MLFDFGVDRAQPQARKKDYAFEGDVIRATKEDFAKWQEQYANIKDLRAMLSVIDAYYACNPPYEGRYYFAMHRWLQKENDRAMAAAKKAEYGTTWW